VDIGPINHEEAVGDEIVECEMIFSVHASRKPQRCFYCGELNLITEMVSLVVNNCGRLIGPRTLCTPCAIQKHPKAHGEWKKRRISEPS
jgi:hypothetical protein